MESYSLMNVFLEGEQLLQVQLEISHECQLWWSFDVSWGECLCNPVVLSGQTVSITWHIMDSRVRLHLCSWLPDFLCLRSGKPCSEQVVQCGGTCSPLAQLHSAGLAASRSPVEQAAPSAADSGVCFFSARRVACLFYNP